MEQFKSANILKSVRQTVKKNMNFNQISEREKISFTLTSLLTLICEILDQGAGILHQFRLRIARPHFCVCRSVCRCENLRKFIWKASHCLTLNSVYRITAHNFANQQTHRLIANNRTHTHTPKNQTLFVNWLRIVGFHRIN